VFSVRWVCIVWDPSFGGGRVCAVGLYRTSFGLGVVVI